MVGCSNHNAKESLGDWYSIWHGSSGSWEETRPRQWCHVIHHTTGQKKRTLCTVKLTPEEEVKKGGRHGEGENVKCEEQQKLEKSCSAFFTLDTSKSSVLLACPATHCDKSSVTYNFVLPLCYCNSCSSNAAREKEPGTQDWWMKPNVKSHFNHTCKIYHAVRSCSNDVFRSEAIMFAHSH